MDLDFVLKKSEEFEQKEARADVYPMIMYWYHKGENNRDKIRALTTLLFIWNIGYFGRARIGFVGATKIVESFFHNKKFQKLKNELQQYDIQDADICSLANKITDFYDFLISYDGIGPTAASKIMHVMQPRLFVMWDNQICNYYHNQIHKKYSHAKGGERCYFAFMENMKGSSINVLRNRREDEVLKLFYDKAMYEKTIPKVLDEANYMTITKGDSKFE